MKTIYKVIDSSWIDGHEDCPCCSGLLFESYNAVGWEQNGSAVGMHDLYSQILYHYLTAGKIYSYEDDVYRCFELDTMREALDKLGIEIEWIGE